MAPVTETFTVQQWSGPCGPPPVSGTAVAGGPATVRSDAGELVITVGGRSIRTDRCVDAMPTLSPETHSSDGRTWRTRCVTPPGDPRHAVINSAFFYNGDAAVSLAETGRYEFTVRGARCIADVAREGSLTRVASASAHAASGPSPAPTYTAPAAAPNGGHRDEANNPCATPGEPTRLEVRPSRKLLRLGESYRFRAVVLDENGCVTPTPIQWSIGAVRSATGEIAPLQVTIDGSGKLEISEGPVPDTKLDVLATAAGRTARASVEVTSPASYEHLLAGSGLDSNGEREEPSVTLIATSSLGAQHAEAEDGARHRRAVFLAIIGGLALLLALVGAYGALRARQARALESAARKRHEERLREHARQKAERDERHAAQVRAHAENLSRAQQQGPPHAAPDARAAGAVFCPSCRREFADGSVFCPFDANRLVPMTSEEARPGGAPPGAAGGICPTCRRGYDPGVRVCPRDGDELVPAAVMGAPAALTPRGKICPTCGERFEGPAAFCGKDGTQLVLLN